MKDSIERPRYSINTAKQLIFDCVMELEYHTENMSDKEIASKLLEILRQMDLNDNVIDADKTMAIDEDDLLIRKLMLGKDITSNDFNNKLNIKQ